MSWISGAVLSAVGGLLLASLPGLSGSVWADTLSVGQQVRITAVILPARYIVVNAEGQIQQIISNTFEVNIVPTVYTNSVKLENARLLTPEIMHRTNDLLKDTTIRPGILYQRPFTLTVVQNKNVLPLLIVGK